MNSQDISNGGTFTATNFSGLASNATQVQVQNTGMNSTHYLTFVDTVGTAQKDLQDTNGLSCNPNSASITATTFNGALSGNATSATNIQGGLGGSIPYQSAVNTTALLANGTAGQVLTSAGTTLAPTWTTPNATTITTADNSTNAVFFPTFVSAVGTGQSLSVDSITNPFSYNPSTSEFVVGTTLKLEASATGKVAVGVGAGATTQGNNTVAVGNGAGATSQGAGGVAIGASAGNNGQSVNGVAIGTSAGQDQGVGSIAIGNNAGNNGQLINGVAIGALAGHSDQGNNSVAIGTFAGETTQGGSAIALGNSAGRDNQGANSIAIGVSAGAGTTSGLGTNSIAIGTNAGLVSQVSNSICLNASGSPISPAQAGCFINPIRAGAGGGTFSPALPANVLYYDTATSEILRTT
jgi:hypothetical protein